MFLNPQTPRFTCLVSRFRAFGAGDCDLGVQEREDLRPPGLDGLSQGGQLTDLDLGERTAMITLRKSWPQPVIG